MKERRILVVEDDPFIAIDVIDVLEAAGLNAIGPIASVSKALDVLERDTFDAAVLNFTLGQETSEPIARTLTTRGIPFVVVTGYARDQLGPYFETIPMLSKPLQKELLLELLDRMLDCDSKQVGIFRSPAH